VEGAGFLVVLFNSVCHMLRIIDDEDLMSDHQNGGLVVGPDKGGNRPTVKNCPKHTFFVAEKIRFAAKHPFIVHHTQK